MITHKVQSEMFSNNIVLQSKNKYYSKNLIEHKIKMHEIDTYKELVERSMINELILNLVKQRQENFAHSEGYSESKLKCIAEIHEYMNRLKSCSYKLFINNYFDYIDKRLFEIRPSIKSRFYQNYMEKLNDIKSFLLQRLN